MYNIVSTLKSSNIIETVEIIDLIDEDNISLLKLKVTLMDESLLYIHELHTQNYQKYSIPLAERIRRNHYEMGRQSSS